MKIKIGFIILCCLYFVAPALAQNKDGMVHLPDTMNFPHIKISEVAVTGNKLTRERIITRELDFRIGDSLATFKAGSRTDFRAKRFYQGDSSELRLRMQYSRENIINTKLFLTVDLALEQLAGNTYRLHIDVTERHYWWLFPVPKLNAPNFNEWLRDPDWSDLSMGLFFSHNNLWGLSHQGSAIGFVGKSWAFALGYYIPWIGKKEKIGLRMGLGYSNLYTLEYGSLENKRQMIYAPNSQQDWKANMTLTIRPGLYNYSTIKLSGEYITISDSVFKLDSNYLAGYKKTNVSLSLYADYYYDSRNSHSYPLKGNLLRVFIDKMGLGLVSKDIDYFYYGIDLHFYQTISKKFYVAEMVKAVNQSGQDAPYYYQQNMTGNKNFIRGYDLYTLKGDQMYFFRSNFKYELIKPAIKKVKEGQEKNKFKAMQYAFYLNAFADCGYVVNKFTTDNPYNNKMLYSWGMGIDFVSYYDLCLRFEYAFTSIGTNGFFIAFGMPI
jgi:outer membrane protein assembly factor BamA